MRATCARVLAAALMTAAIASVVGMSALFRPASQAARPIAAPPSSLQRTVRLTAHVQAPRRQSRPSPARLVTRSTIAVRPRPAPVTRLATVRKHRTRRPGPPRQLAATTTTTVTTTTTPAPPAVEPAAASAPAPDAQPGDAEDGPGRHGRGHAYGHDKQDD
jgi:hypothetical protein